jgi:transglutaminase-like putative cysteine protease
MKAVHGFLLVMALAIPAATVAMPDSKFDRLMERVEKLQEKGSLADADAAVKKALQQEDLSDEQKQALDYELVRSVRIAQDYSVDEPRLRELLKERYEGVTDKEIDNWIGEGRFDRKKINGEWRYVGASLSNLFFRHEDVRARRKAPREREWVDYLLKHTRTIMDQTDAKGDVLADPVDYQIHMTITVKKDAVPAGEIIRCWMPYPQQFAAQTGVELLSSTPAIKYMNAPDYPMRSLYFEQPSKGSEPTQFEATYTMTTYPRYYRLDPEVAASVDQTANEYYEVFTSEQEPHVVFTPRMEKLAKQITGGETNPVKKARLIYDWLAANKKYSYAREYSTLRCIPDYVLDNGYGDCGQIALTYIALCRASGIPARWQSGWVIYPEWENLHDWTEIYIAPYGWVPVDPDFGMEFQQTYEFLTDAELKQLQDFYFGGLDAHRLVANRDHGYPHFPEKKDFRSDNVDFQRGELETASGRNIYFDQFGYNLEKTILEPGKKAAIVKQEGGAKEPQGPAAPGLAR